MTDEILLALLEGRKYDEIGKCVGLSKQRIGQIANNLTTEQRSIREKAVRARKEAEESQILHLASMGLGRKAIVDLTQRSRSYVGKVLAKHGVSAPGNRCRCDHAQMAADKAAGMKNYEIARKHGVNPFYVSRVLRSNKLGEQ